MLLTRGPLEGEDPNLRTQLKFAIWIDAVNIALWLFSAVYDTLSIACCL
jgi:hypothetical protein